MADRGAGHGVSWFVIGFLAGVAATLGVLIYGSARSMRTLEASPAPRSAMNATGAHAPSQCRTGPMSRWTNLLTG